MRCCAGSGVARPSARRRACRRRSRACERDELSIRRVRRRAHGEVDGAERLRQRMHLQRQPRDDGEVAAAASFQRPEQVLVRARVADADLAVAGHRLGLDETSRGSAERLREAAEAAALHEPGDADGRAAAALHIAPRLRRHRVVDVRPHRAGTAVHGALRRDAAAASRGNERVVEAHVVHASRPDEQRVGRVRRALVAVAAALDDESHAPLAREVDRSGDGGGVPRDDCIRARRRRPRTDPAERLRQRDVVADRPRIRGGPEQCLARRRARIGATRSERRYDPDERAAHRGVQALPIGVARPAGIAGANAIARLRIRCRECRERRRAADPLHRARDDERDLRVREPAHGRGGGEEHDADHEHATVSVEVAEPSAEEEKAAARQQIGIEDPHQRRLGEAEVGADRRQRDFDERRIEHDHHDAETDDGEREPAAGRGIRCGHG